MPGSKLPNPHRIVISECHKHRRRAAICHFTAFGRARRSVRLHEDEAFRHEEDGGRALPADTEPLGFGAGMEEGGAATVLGKPAYPTADLVAIEGRIEPHTAVPSAIEPVLRFRDVYGRTVPPARIGGARIAIR